ncbi:collagen binding domain-containing protein, partial [Anaerobacillus sp. 1_MG-2023]|uniref:MSCRAMM family protein n=1 Tax=Anaerobacillus sp. 1_MG-2023 TaxID=3062655 RepID=UPI0026E2C1EC
VVVNNLRPGNYTFVETKAPFGYVLDPTPIEFAIAFNNSERVNVEAKNTLQKFNAELTKKDVDSGEVIPGAIFELQD